MLQLQRLAPWIMVRDSRFWMKKKGGGIVSPPVAFCRRFFRKVRRLEPTGGPNTFRPASTTNLSSF